MTWYAFTVTPQLERRAWDGLAKLHIEPARLEIPRIYRLGSGRGRRTIMRPLLPGYALGSVSGPIPWPLIRMIEYKGQPIIHDVLRAGSIPAAIPADEIDRLTAYLSETDHTGPGTLRPGAKARVSIGRHDDQHAVIKRVLSEARCTVMMRWFNSDREVSTSVERIREAG
jgi:hypothetical protein